MKRVVTKKLAPGMVLANDVHTYDSNIKLLDKGTILEEKDIARLAFYSILDVLVEDDPVETEALTSLENSELSYSERLKQSESFKEFKADFEQCVNGFQNSIRDIIDNNDTYKMEEVMAPIYKLLGKGHTASSIFDMLHNLRDYDDATYTHSINVALIANILAQWLKWDESEIEIATQAGLFHDIGKIMIPNEIITKPDKLTSHEYDIVQTHPQRGYEVIRNLSISAHVKNATLMHHERCDGTGYPLHIKAPQIDKFAKLIAIADVYDAMTSARYYRGPLCPFIAISMFEDEGFQRYDPEMILAFLSNIVDTYLLNRVRLNTGEVGEIVFINRNKFSKPTIKIGEDYVDLSKCPNVYIAEII
ncbi:HD-GYP domain-containing protein [Butyrivibrio proteoclasticus]|uniref:HD-GYP domain-containing protein n=1 Tax=Butyrivibrio proteoclasticus TaxID=43305 RepID=UPI000478F459|nr:HD-GYP domain-containing protein [Butyrivibrio proteoclasticus]